MKKSGRFPSLIIILAVVLVAIIGGTNMVSAQSVCIPATPISVPFTKDGAGTFCYQATSMCYAINSWNMTSLQINGNNYTNMWVSGPSIPALNGVFTITYNGGQFGHFEITGPCSSSLTATATLTRTPTQVIAVSTTPALTATRTRTVTSGPSLTPTRSATVTPTRTAFPTEIQPWIGVALASNFPNTVYIGGNNVMVTVSTNMENTNAIFSIIVIDAATGQEQSQTNPIVSPARPDPQTANQILGNLANFTFDGLRPGTVFFRSTVSGSQGSLTKDSANVTVVSGPTPTKTATPTATPTPVLGPCSPVNATITIPFVQDGVGNFCWKVSTLNFINSFNTASVNVNGLNFTNVFAVPGSFPPQIGGFWYITYIGNTSSSHFEAK